MELSTALIYLCKDYLLGTVELAEPWPHLRQRVHWCSLPRMGPQCKTPGIATGTFHYYFETSPHCGYRHSKAPRGQESGWSGKVKLGRCLQFLTRKCNVAIYVFCFKTSCPYRRSLPAYYIGRVDVSFSEDGSVEISKRSGE